MIFECEYCETKFLTEKEFGKHRCREQERAEMLCTNEGVEAYTCYKTWFKKRKRFTPSQQIFIGSRYYNTFIKFAKFSDKVAIPDVDMYIGLMVEKEVLPQHWYHADIYEMFLEYLDYECSPQAHLRITLQTLERISGIFECKMGEVFFELEPADMVRLIQSRNISPWVLLLSPKFKLVLANEMIVNEREFVENAIKLDRWKLIIKRGEKHIPEIRTYINQLDL
jgi:hypothetical protein